jgi:AGZA family xanthine/uracil permease-like MFS transporter
MLNAIRNFFHLKENKTTIATEVMAGFTTFMAMAYIIFVNPSFLSQTGMDFTAVMIGTCIAAAVGTLLTAFIANVPFAQAPGMGLNAFFTFTVCFGMGYSWQQALAIVLLSGILFLLVAISPLRSKIISSIPASLKSAISVGIGLFIALIGLFNAEIITANDNLLSLNLVGAPQLLALGGLLLTAIFMMFKLKGAILFGIIATTIVALIVGVAKLPTDVALHNISLAPVFFKFDFNLLSLGLIPLITTILSFTLVDMFDTVGTLIGTAENAGMLDKDGNLPRGDRALIADAIATCAGACLGTSTVTTYVESATGIEQGGRTGLTSVVVGILFLLAIFLAPIAGIVPAAATAPALIIVGVLMMGSVSKIDWKNLEVAIPAFLTVVMMPFAYSISDGIGFGFISYTLIKLIRGKAHEVHWLMWILSSLFVLKYLVAFL